jgi:hypothetical protein
MTGLLFRRIENATNLAFKLFPFSDALRRRRIRDCLCFLVLRALNSRSAGKGRFQNCVILRYFDATQRNLHTSRRYGTKMNTGAVNQLARLTGIHQPPSHYDRFEWQP